MDTHNLLRKRQIYATMNDILQREGYDSPQLYTALMNTFKTRLEQNNWEDFLNDYGPENDQLEDIETWLNDIAQRRDSATSLDSWAREALQAWTSNLDLVAAEQGYPSAARSLEIKLFGVCRAYLKHLHHEAEVRDNEQNPSNTYAGQDGDVVEFRIESFTETNRHQGGAGGRHWDYPTLELKDAAGHTYSWNNSSNIPVRVGDILKGKIKQCLLTHWGVRLTIIWRCRVVGHSDHPDTATHSVPSIFSFLN